MSNEYVSKIDFSWNIIHGRNVYTLADKSEKNVSLFPKIFRSEPLFAANSGRRRRADGFSFARPEQSVKVDSSGRRSEPFILLYNEWNRKRL